MSRLVQFKSLICLATGETLTKFFWLDCPPRKICAVTPDIMACFSPKKFRAAETFALSDRSASAAHQIISLRKDKRIRADESSAFISTNFFILKTTADSLDRRASGIFIKADPLISYRIQFQLCLLVFFFC